MSIRAYPASTAITTFGVVNTFRGVVSLARGCIQSGIKSVFLGMSSMNIGGRLLGLEPTTHSELVEGTLAVGVGIAGLEGVKRFSNGVKQKSVVETLKGGMQAASSIAGAALIHNLDSKVLIVANEASILALSSSFVAKMGLADLSKGRYLTGLSKILLGAGGVASAGYYLCSVTVEEENLLEDQLTALKKRSRKNDQSALLEDEKGLSTDQLSFLKAHNQEIEQMCKQRVPVGNWKQLGSGFSKVAFTHPELVGALIKVSASAKGFRALTGEKDLELHVKNRNEVGGIAAQFNRIILPKSYLHRTEKNNLIVVEEKLPKLFFYEDVPNTVSKRVAVLQFKRFIKETGLCDVDVESSANAAIISNRSPVTIGIFDFDCKHPPQVRECPGQQGFFTHNALGAFGASIGGAVVAGISSLSKKVSGVDPNKVFQLGLGFGAVAGAILGSRSFCQPADTLFASGFAMPAAAIATVAVSKIHSWGKSCFQRFFQFQKKLGKID